MTLIIFTRSIAAPHRKANREASIQVRSVNIQSVAMFGDTLLTKYLISGKRKQEQQQREVQ